MIPTYGVIIAQLAYMVVLTLLSAQALHGVLNGFNVKADFKKELLVSLVFVVSKSIIDSIFIFYIGLNELLIIPLSTLALMLIFFLLINRIYKIKKRSNRAYICLMWLILIMVIAAFLNLIVGLLFRSFI